METSASKVPMTKIRATERAKTKSFGGAMRINRQQIFGKKKHDNMFSDIYNYKNTMTEKPKGWVLI